MNGQRIIVVCFCAVLSVMAGCSGKQKDKTAARVFDQRLDAPFGLAAQAGDSRNRLTWEEVPGTYIYNLYWSNTPNVDPVKANRIEKVTSPYQHRNLNNEQTYYYVVTAVNIGQLESGASNEVASTPNTPPAGAPEVEIVPGEERISLWWRPVDEASSYEVFISDKAGVKLENGRRLNIPVTAFTGLQAYKTYYFIAAAVNAAGEMTPSLEFSATPLPARLFPPGKITAKNGTNGTTIAWTAVSGATQYKLYWSTFPNVDKNNEALATTALTLLHSGLSKGVRYYYRLASLNENIQSPLSEEFSIIALDTLEGGPNLNAEPGEASITLSWNTIDQATNYNLYVEQNGNNSVIANVTSPYTHTGLEKVNYNYHVAAIVSAQERVSNTVSATPLFPPATPANFQVFSAEQAVRLQWDHVPAAIGYTIYWREAGAGPASTQSIASTTPGYVHTGLDAAKTYQYQVSARNKDGESARSPELTGKPLAPPPPAVDLVVTDAVIALNANDTITHGQPIEIRYTVKNAGALSTAVQTPWSGGFYVGFDLSHDTSTNNFNQPGIRYFTHFEKVPDLAPGAVHSGQFTYIVPQIVPGFNTLYSPGAYFMRVYVDAWNDQLENNENNNDRFIAAKPLQLTADNNEDLTITGLSVAATTFSKGQTVSVPTTVTNAGGSTSYGNWIKYYLVDGPALPVNLVTRVKIGDFKMTGAIAPGQTTVTANFFVPFHVTPGNYYLAAQVDADEEQLEINESNNWFVNPAAIAVTDNAALLGPNIHVKEFRILDPQPSYAQNLPIRAQVTIENTGDLPYADRTRNSDQAILLALTYANSARITEGTMNIWPTRSPQPGESIVLDTWLFNGDYNFDYWNPLSKRQYVVPDVGEANLRFLFRDSDIGAKFDQAIQIHAAGGADVIISSFLVDKTHFAAGDEIRVSFTVVNIGAAPTGGFYTELDLGDPYSNWMAAFWIPQLAPGASNSQSAVLHIPAVVDGKYNLRISANLASQIEIDSTNNSRSLPVQVATNTDMNMTSLSLDEGSVVRAGGEIGLTLTMRNDGSGSGFWGYINANAAFDGVDYPFDYGLNYSKSIEFIPPGEIGTYKFKMQLPYFLRAGSYTLDVVSTVANDINTVNNQQQLTLNIAAMTDTPLGFPLAPGYPVLVIDQNAYLEEGKTYDLRSLVITTDGFLRIQKGAVLKFSAEGLFVNKGGLVVDGIEGNPVIFTGVDTAAESWSGITSYRKNGGNMLMNFAQVEYAVIGLSIDEGQVYDSLFTHNNTGILIKGNSYPVIGRCRIENNTQGIRIEGANPNIGTPPLPYPLPLIHQSTFTGNSIWNISADFFPAPADGILVRVDNNTFNSTTSNNTNTIFDATDNPNAGSPTIDICEGVCPKTN